MKILPVKEYNKWIAEPKYINNRKMPKSAFIFMLEDNKGYPTTYRKRGYIAYDENRAVFGMNICEAIKKFKGV